jgi:fibronectin-binding autotransporter adhesin
MDVGANILTNSGVISGAGSLTKAGAGTMVLGAANTYTGGTTINAGTVAISNGSSFGSNTVTFASNGTRVAALASVQVTNNYALTGNGTMDVGANVLTNSGVISGAGSLTKAGAGTMVLGAANTYTGGTTINAGTVAISNGASFGSNTVTFASNGTTVAALASVLVTNNYVLTGSGTMDVGANVLTNSGVISGAGSLTKEGTGTMVLGAANTYTGGTTINAGTVAISNGSSFGSNTVTFASNDTTVAALASVRVTNDYALTGSGTMDVGANILTNSGVISGAGSLTKAGAGTMVLGAANTYTGGTTINAGTVAISNGASFGSNTVTFASNGTRVVALASVQVTNDYALTGNGTMDVGANNLTNSGVISGAGSLTKAGAGTMLLSGLNTYGGTTTVGGGTLQVTNLANAGVNSAIGTNGTIILTNGGTLDYAGTTNSSMDRGISLASGNGGIGVSNSAVALTNSGVISGGGSLTKSGAGTMVLTASNTYTGVTTVSNGTLNIQNDTALGPANGGTNGRTVVASGASLELQNNITVTGESLSIAGTGVGTNGALRNLSGTNTWTGPIGLTATTKIQSEAGELVISGSIDNGVPSFSQRSTGYGLTVDGPANTTLSGLVALDSANITKTGAGTLTISGNNTSAGNLNINGGVLQAAASTNLGRGEIDFDGGTLRTTATTTLTPSTRPIDIGSNGGTIDVVADTTLTHEGSMTGTGKLTKIGTGTFSVGQLTNYSVAVGTTGVPTNKFGSPSYYNFDQLTPGSGGTQVVTNSFGPTNSMTVTFDGTAVVRQTNSTFSPSPNGGNGAGFGTNGTTQPNGTNVTPWLWAPENNTITMNLSQPSRYFGLLWGIPDPTLDILSFRDATNGVLFEISGANVAITNWGSYYVNVNSDIPFSSVVAIIPNTGSGQQFEFDNVATSTNGATRSGPLDILEGEFQVINNGVFNTVGSTEAVLVASGATLRFNGSTNVTQQNIGTLSGAGTVINSGSNALSLHINATSNSTFSGVITDTTNNLSLVKLGSATQTLSGNNTYKGTTIISNGVLQIGDGGTNGTLGTGAVTNQAGLVINRGGTYLVSNNIAGTGGLTNIGAGTVTLTGSNTYSGGTTLSAGHLRLNTTNAAGTGTITQADGSSVLEINAGGTVANAMSVYNVAFVNGGNTLSGPITLNNAIFTNVASGVTNTITGELTGTGGITKQGDGGLIIAGSVSNSFTGTSVVEGGTLILSNSAGGAVSGTSIQVNSGASLILAASDQIGNTTGLILNGGTFVVGTSSAGYSDDLGTLTLNANSVIDLGTFTGLHSLTFANSSGIAWATNATLTISNWQGVTRDPGDAGRIFFGEGGLTSAQLAQVYWAPQNISGGVLINANGELTPIPEPRVYAAALVLLAAVGWRERKRLLSLLRR